MTVLSFGENDRGHLVGDVRWRAAPGAVFQLELTRDGRLIEWRARADEGRALSARQLRAAPVGAMERSIRRKAEAVASALGEVAELARQVMAGIEPDLNDPDPIEQAYAAAHAVLSRRLPGGERYAASLADFAERPRTGPAGRSDQSYAALAALYVQVIAEGAERPIGAVAGRLGLAQKTVQNHLYKARERGLLTSLGRGKAGGQLTDKAKEMLSGNDQAS